MIALDGNAIAGDLIEVLGVDLAAAVASSALLEVSGRDPGSTIGGLAIEAEIAGSADAVRDFSGEARSAGRHRNRRPLDLLESIGDQPLPLRPPPRARQLIADEFTVRQYVSVAKASQAMATIMRRTVQGAPLREAVQG